MLTKLFPMKKHPFTSKFECPLDSLVIDQNSVSADPIQTAILE